jgi:putative zinc finger protein
MKCEVCQEHLEEYLDGELVPVEQEEINAHLITCADCSASFATLTAEQELFSRYDREIEVPPFLWTRIAQHTVAENRSTERGWRAQFASVVFTGSFAAGLAIVLFALLALVGLNSVDRNRVAKGPDPDRTPQKKTTTPNQQDKNKTPTPGKDDPRPKPATTPEHLKREQFAFAPRVKRKVIPHAKLNQSDVLSSDLGYLDIYERDTARHIEQTQNLLRSIRNVSLSDGDEEIDVTYDKALSRRLLNENVVLRRDAEMKAKFPTKSLLADVEPFLIDIANLPDNARPEDVRMIKERVQKTEIVAALMSYQGRDLNNR